MLADFLKKNNLTGLNIFNVITWFNVLWNLKVIQFLLVGGTGVLLQLAVTCILTQFLFGVKQYYIGYAIGLIANLIYNFILHTKFTFNTKNKHKKRLIRFITYSLSVALFQYVLVRVITKLTGDAWYLLVIAIVILICSILTYFTFKLWLFKE